LYLPVHTRQAIGAVRNWRELATPAILACRFHVKFTEELPSRTRIARNLSEVGREESWVTVEALQLAELVVEATRQAIFAFNLPVVVGKLPRRADFTGG
jgi:hypothetical protein